MFKFKMLPLVFALGLIAQPCYSDLPVPDMDLSVATIPYSGTEMITLLVVPDGSGGSFAEARDASGNMVDATITLTILGVTGRPFSNYPRQDVWLEFPGGVSLFGCLGFSTSDLIADHDANSEGVTHWSAPPFAGGYNEGPVFVLINGQVLRSNSGLPIRFNSPDINGDLAVDLTDVSIIASDYFSGYQFRSDMNGDGVINLSDITKFTNYYGIRCP